MIFCFVEIQQNNFLKIEMHFIVGPGGICSKERMCIYYVNFTLL